MELVPSPRLIDRIRELAKSRGVDPQRLLDEALQQYIEASAITDVTPEEVGRTQDAMLGEIDLGEWHEGRAA